MTDERRAYTLKCVCGFTRKKHIGRPPKVCPQCGAKPEPDGMNRAMRRKLAREMRRGNTTVGSPDLEPQDAA